MANNSYWNIGDQQQKQHDVHSSSKMSDVITSTHSSTISKLVTNESRLVGVPTMGRVIPISRMATTPQTKVVLHQEQKMEDDLNNLMMDPSVIVSESTGLLIHPSSSQELIETPPGHPSSKIVRKVSNKTFPNSILEIFLTAYKTGNSFDCVWECDGGKFKVRVGH